MLDCVALTADIKTDAKTRFLSGAVEHTFEKAARTPPLLQHSVQLQKDVLNMALNEEKHNQNLTTDIPRELTMTETLAHHIVNNIVGPSSIILDTCSLIPQLPSPPQSDTNGANPSVIRSLPLYYR